MRVHPRQGSHTGCEAGPNVDKLGRLSAGWGCHVAIELASTSCSSCWRCCLCVYTWNDSSKYLFCGLVNRSLRSKFSVFALANWSIIKRGSVLPFTARIAWPTWICWLASRFSEFRLWIAGESFTSMMRRFIIDSFGGARVKPRDSLSWRQSFALYTTTPSTCGDGWPGNASPVKQMSEVEKTL